MLVEPRAARVPDAALTNGCFETMRAYRGKLFRLDDHLDRLYASAKFLGTRIGDRAALARELEDALRRSKFKEAVVRVAIMSHASGPARPSIVVRGAIVPTPAMYRNGIAVRVVPAQKFSNRSVEPQAKYSARLGSVLAVCDLITRGGDEALFMDPRGCITESTASNLGMVRGDVLITPPCWLGLLAGITRDVLIEIAPRLGLQVQLVPITRHDLYNADEVFLTSTLKEVLAVTTVDGRRIGHGRPGPVTQRLLRGFRALVAEELGFARRTA